MTRSVCSAEGEPGVGSTALLRPDAPRLEGVDHRIRGTLEVVPEGRLERGWEGDLVHRGTHVSQPSIARVGVDVERHVPHAQARVSARRAIG
ncbi:MAG: hypothetical protein K0S70_5098, partial [Microbacterium sp.]|nr:hypothetical protein [Microbacterium sp.]